MSGYRNRHRQIFHASETFYAFQWPFKDILERNVTADGLTTIFWFRLFFCFVLFVFFFPVIL